MPFPKALVKFVKPNKNVISPEAQNAGKTPHDSSKGSTNAELKSDNKPGKSSASDPYVIYANIRFNPKWVLNARSDTYFYWLVVMACAILYNLVMIVPRAVFEQLEEDSRTYYIWICLDYLSDIAYLLDMVVNLLTGYYENGLLIHEPRKLIKRYRKSSQFIKDCVSVLPTDLVFFYTGRQVPFILLRLNRILRLPRLSEFLYRAESRVDSPAVFRMFCLFGELFVIVHINGCVYYSFSSIIGIGSDDWVYPATAAWREVVTNNSDFVNDTMIQKWSVCTYWSAMMLTSILPQMNNPKTDPEILFHVAEMFLGIVLFTFILGQISEAIESMDRKQDLFKNKRDSVRSYIRMRKVGNDMETIVMRWFDYIWNTKQDLDEESVLNVLPENLRKQIAKSIHFDVLQKVPLFRDVPNQFLEDLAVKLQFQPFNPGSYVCRKGDIGREMYVIRRGRLDVVSDDGKTIFVTLKAGAVFGELSILNVPGNKNQNRRTANVRSVGYADLFSLSKDDLWEALEEYPEVADGLLEKATANLKRDRMYSEEVAKEAERVSCDYEGKVAELESQIEVTLANIEVVEKRFASSLKELVNEISELEGLLENEFSFEED